MTVTAILAAAGRGNRFGRPKQLLELAGKPLAVWSLETLARNPQVTALVIACEAEDCGRFEPLATEYGNGKVVRVIAGGVRRQDSVCAALNAAPADTDFVLVHDGARPFLTDDLVDRCIAAARQTGAAITAVPVKDTIKRAGDGAVVMTTIPREHLWAAQTPQVFAFDVLKQAHERANNEGFLGTDDAMLVEWAALAPVAIVQGSYENIKITTEEDLAVAERIAARHKAAT